MTCKIWNNCITYSNTQKIKSQFLFRGLLNIFEEYVDLFPVRHSGKSHACRRSEFTEKASASVAWPKFLFSLLIDCAICGFWKIHGNTGSFHNFTFIILRQNATLNIYQKQLVLTCFSVLFQVNNSNRLAELCGIPRDKKISSLECRCAIVISGLEKEVLAAEDPPLTPDEQQLTDFYECTLEEFPRPVIQLPIWTKFRKWGWGFSPSDGY